MNLDLVKLGVMNNDSYLLDKVKKHNSFASDFNTFINNYACIRIYNYMYNIIKDIFDKGWDCYPVMYSSEKFINEFMQIFKKYDVAPEYIEVEILERSIMEDDTLLEITNLLHKEGFKVAMDDFGVGESSLNMLTKIPVDVLKFDREFLLNSTNEKGEMDKKNAVFIQTLVNLSKNLEKQTIFEGVETKVQRDFLKKIKCDQVQGYFYSKPLTEDDFLQFLTQHL